MAQNEFNAMYERVIKMWEGAYYNVLNSYLSNPATMRKIFNRVKLVSHRNRINEHDSLCYLISNSKLIYR